MDDNHFDHLARVLGSGASRRAALGLAAAGLGIALRGIEPAAAKRKQRRKGKACRPKCSKGQTCVHGACLKMCPKSGTCQDGSDGPPDCGGPDSDCGCVKTASGHTACLAPSTEDPDGCASEGCKRDKDCPKGQVCAVVQGCCEGKPRICAVPCPPA